MRNKKSNSIITLALLLGVVLNLVLRLSNLILASEIQITADIFKKTINLISNIYTQINAFYFIPILFWLILIVLIPYSIYRKEVNKYFISYILTFVNIVLFNGLSKNFFDACIEYVTLNYRVFTIILATISVLVFSSLFIRKIATANIEIKQKDSTKSINSVKPVDVISENTTESSVQNITSSKNTNTETGKINTESFEKHPYLSTFYKLRNRVLKNISDDPKNNNDVNIFLSIVFFLTILLLLVFIVICIKNQQPITDLLQSFFNNLEQIFNMTNHNADSLEGSLTRFFLSLGVLLLIPIIFLLVVLVFVFSFGILIYSIARTSMLKEYINKIVDRIEYFFFETILNTINPFILIPDFVSTIIFTVFGIDVEDYVSDKTNSNKKGANDGSK